MPECTNTYTYYYISAGTFVQVAYSKDVEGLVIDYRRDDVTQVNIIVEPSYSFNFIVDERSLNCLSIGLDLSIERSQVQCSAATVVVLHLSKGTSLTSTTQPY